MEEMFVFAGLGVLGALVRAVFVGVKSWSIGKFSWGGYRFYIWIVLITGVLSGIVLSYSKALGFLGGYAGVDLMDVYYKKFMGSKVKVGK